MVFYSSSRVPPPEKSIANSGVAPFLFPTEAVNIYNGEFFQGGSCKTMVFYSSSRVHPQKNPLPYLEEPFLIFFPGGKYI